MPELASDSSYPGIGIGTVQNGIGGAGGSTDTENRYIINDNVTLIRGRHSFTMGGEVRWLQRNEHGIPGGSFTFEPTQTALNGTGFANGQPVTIPVGTGAPAASFLLGGMDFVNFSYPIESAFRWWQTGLFLQDDWRVSPNLTLNLGIRWDLQIPRTDPSGDVSTMDPTLANPAAGGIPGAFTYYGSGPGRNGDVTGGGYQVTELGIFYTGRPTFTVGSEFFWSKVAVRADDVPDLKAVQFRIVTRLNF